MSDLAAYRDDAHLAAWQPHRVEGHTWEAFTYLWSGEATTLDGLHKKLERRGYSRDEYGQALADLIQRGWVWEKAGEYQVTDLGRETRQAAEEATDQYFNAPWTCLSQGETEELRSLAASSRWSANRLEQQTTPRVMGSGADSIEAWPGPQAADPPQPTAPAKGAGELEMELWSAALPLATTPSMGNGLPGYLWRSR